MPDLTDLVVEFHRFGHTDIKILMVVDKTIRTVEGPGEFGIGRVARLIDGYARGCSSFSVDTARRDPYPQGPGAPIDQNQGHISTTFRFDDLDANGKLVIAGYDQIWLFGFHSEGQGPVTSGPELQALTDWMNKGGGLFATGDHEDLGASMCSGIPRVREMRRWTNAQQVPPAGGHDRLDTNRPVNNAEATGASPMAFAHERDTTPQHIHWVPMSSQRVGFRVYETPHEVLCHPQLGAINVMPDHPHEGRTRTVSEINLARTYNFGGGVGGDDFPTSGANQPTPVVIATGETVADPPTDKSYKPPSAGYFKFPMISVYDGRSVGVKGRVATDSTWHHWFDLNIYGLEHAADTTNWRKIERYYQNLAVWLAPPGRFREKCWFVHQWFEYPLIEELDLAKIDLRGPHPELGRIVREQFRAVFGPCTTSRFVWETLCELAPRICRPLEQVWPHFPHGPIPDPGPVCLTCPPLPLFEEAVFEGLMLATIPFMEQWAGQAEKLDGFSDARLDKAFNEFMAPAVTSSVQRYAKSVLDDLDQGQKVWRQVAAAKPVANRRAR